MTQEVEGRLAAVSEHVAEIHFTQKSHAQQTTEATRWRKPRSQTCLAVKEDGGRGKGGGVVSKLWQAWIHLLNCNTGRREKL